MPHWAVAEAVPPHATPNETFIELGRLQCEKILACPEPELADFESVEACLAEFIEYYDLDNENLNVSVAAGRVAWDYEDAAACTQHLDDYLASTTCEEYWDDQLNLTDPLSIDPVCTGLGKGQVADGEACTSSSECANSESDCVQDVCTHV